MPEFDPVMTARLPVSDMIALPMLHLRNHATQEAEGEASAGKEKNAGARPALSL
jgi:hypothetical protein